MEHIRQNTLIQKAIQIYLQMKNNRSVKNLMKEGYQEMYGLSEGVMKDFEKLDQDSLNYVD